MEYKSIVASMLLSCLFPKKSQKYLKHNWCSHCLLQSPQTSVQRVTTTIKLVRLRPISSKKPTPKRASTHQRNSWKTHEHRSSTPLPATSVRHMPTTACWSLLYCLSEFRDLILSNAPLGFSISSASDLHLTHSMTWWRQPQLQPPPATHFSNHVTQLETDPWSTEPICNPRIDSRLASIALLTSADPKKKTLPLISYCLFQVLLIFFFPMNKLELPKTVTTTFDRQTTSCGIVGPRYV
jgi:hypothetical protein